MTDLAEARLGYAPRVPAILRRLDAVHCAEERRRNVDPAIAALFPYISAISPRVVAQGGRAGRPLKVAALFSGGPAAGGHNVLAGLFDGLQQIDARSRLFGFLGGFSGLVKNRSQELARGEIDRVRNQGGFELIGTGRTKLESEEDLAAAAKALEGFDALVVIGGDDSNTNAAMLAEFLQGRVSVIGVPKTIDGDLRSAEIEMSFGFDSACKTYAESIGNIAKDALSTKKYYHFIKLMGRSASHIALECALAVQPNLTLIGEERKTLDTVVGEIADLIARRKAAGKEYGVILVPEGLVEFMPEMKALIRALNADASKLGAKEKETFDRLPEKIRDQLLLDRDPHGNVLVSQIATEQLLMQLVKKRLGGGSFQDHFFGYEGRSCLPTNFDADYAYALGMLAALGARDRLAGVICAIQFLREAPSHWIPRFAPLASMMRLEERRGKNTPVIDKALVDLKGKAFLYFSLHRKKWEVEDAYRFPGPIQFFGDSALTDSFPRTL